jgi:excisionase family DNA binding protein
MVQNKNERPLTVREAANSLNLSEECIRVWIARRRIGFMRLGRAIRIPQSEIDRLLTQGMQPARETRAR